MIIDRNSNIIVSLDNEEENKIILKYKAEICYEEKYLVKLDDVKKRLYSDIKLIQENGLSKSFLILKELFNWAKLAEIEIRATGLFYSSFVSHLFNINEDYDPILANIYMERDLYFGGKNTVDCLFANSITLLIENYKIDKILEHMKDLYGKVNVLYDDDKLTPAIIIGDNIANDEKIYYESKCENGNIDYNHLIDNKYVIIFFNQDKELRKLSLIKKTIKRNNDKEYKYNYFDKNMVELIKNRDFENIYEEIFDDDFKSLIEDVPYVNAKVLQDIIALKYIRNKKYVNEYIDAMKTGLKLPTLYDTDFMKELENFGFSLEEAGFILYHLQNVNMLDIDISIDVNEIKKVKDEFIKKLEQNGFSKDKANNLWDTYVDRASYLKNKAIVERNTKIIFNEIYYKANFPKEFNEAILLLI